MFADLCLYVDFTCRLCLNVILGLQHMKYELLKENLHLLIHICCNKKKHPHIQSHKPIHIKISETFKEVHKFLATKEGQYHEIRLRRWS